MTSFLGIEKAWYRKTTALALAGRVDDACACVDAARGSVAKEGAALAVLRVALRLGRAFARAIGQVLANAWARLKV